MDEASVPSRQTVAAVVARAVDAYRALIEVAETIEDEWQYVEDLSATYVAALEAAADPAPARPEAVVAVDEAIAEIALITDPNRAIDWLSTFPHVVALALGTPLAEAAVDAGWDAEPGPGPEAPEDSPFRALLRRDDR